MARAATSFVCQACGAVQPRWAGRCDACGGWNSFVEESIEPIAKGTPARRRRGGGLELVALEGEGKPFPRLETSIDELDRALGGGLVAGSAVLLGGDPGIGKSTLTLQAAASLATAGRRVVYLSGEELIEQIRLRAARIGLGKAAVELAVGTSVDAILATLDGPSPPDLLVIDSIQTVYLEALDPAPGTVTQLRAASQALIRFAKKRGTALLLIGHVTKEGQIAGPRVLEHMVDTVLYFEGERGHQFRLLRAVKNRFGPANEIGVFEMRESGLEPVANPSALFLGRSRGGRQRGCRLRRDGGHAAGARRDPGSGGTDHAGDAQARRCRLGQRSARHAAGRSRRPVRPCDGRPGRLSQRRGRVEDRRAGS